MIGLVKYDSAPSTRFPFPLLNQPACCAYLTEHRHPNRLRVNEHTFTPVINLEYSLTGRALCLSQIVLDVILSAEGADHFISG